MIAVVIIGLIMGVAFWILPRFSRPPIRGNEIVAGLAFFILNFGIVMIMVGNFFQVNVLFELIGRVLESIAVILFVIHANLN